ncbi:ABC transporter substrate-binding protein [Belnapia rosea]|uniref:ABC transporter substrate-binding protein n=1 Tax=Belnapia rosea TaxID=938405 RepID=UPI00088BDB7A|nr:ABC transporter substrate-binding protein [Belnapia rosea]SDB46993.1 amino acid/amide ABC transporter substrate-binding protein, HAAT family (TC 3.A.1.4.-) [Belnapia rosea]
MVTIGRRALLGTTLGTGAALAMPAVRAGAQGGGGSPGVKIGLVAVLTGPQAALGTQLRDGFLQGLKHLDGKLGGLPAEVVVIDDELRPEVAVTKVRAAIERDKVDVVAGVVFSNILAAIIRPVTESGTFLISTNAGPSTLAGRGCNPNFFTTSYNNDQVHSVMGQAAQDSGYRRVFVMTPNYQAGRDAAAGFKSRFKGEVVDEVYVPLTQLDFSAELAKIAAAKPDALFTFMPGGLGVNLVRQYRQAGLANIPFLSTFTVDEATLPAQGEAALGFYSAASWAPNMENAANLKFVRDFEAAYGYVPATYAAQSYDSAMLLDSAIRKVGGRMADKDAFRAALRAADFRSVRGPFKFGANHYPVQDFWLCQVAKRADGKFQTETVRKVLENDTDPYAAECRMR